MQGYAKAAKELLDKAASLTLRSSDSPQRGPAPMVLLQPTTTSIGGGGAGGGGLGLSILNNLSSLAGGGDGGGERSNGDGAPSPSPSSAAAPPGPLPLDARVSRFKQELLASRIDLAALRRLALQGVPDRDGLRAVTWKLLLGYLPPDPSEWDEVLARKRTEYLLFCEDLIVDPKQQQQREREQRQREQQQREQQAASAAEGTGGGGEARGGGEGEGAGCSGSGGDPLSGGGGAGAAAAAGGGGGTTGGAAGASSGPLVPSSSAVELRAGDEPVDDHPLALHQGSKWKAHFEDGEVLEQIDRDVLRTHPDMHFFGGDGDAAAAHRAEMRRALFVYAKLNPGLRYIQGMNELLAPLYHAFKTDPDATSARYAEADAFYCFVELLSDCRDHFCQQLDNSASGIRATIRRLVAVLAAHDPELAAHLERERVDPQFFAFRWITLLLTQELPFPDAVRVWDALLADPAGRLDCLLRVCVALLAHVRAPLLAGDFSAIVKLLQRYPSVDVDVVLRAAARLPPCASVLGAPL